MYVMRPAMPGDLDALLALARETGPGLTSFKPDRQRIGERIERSLDSLAGAAPLAERTFLFVLEDGERGVIVGVSGIDAAVGLKRAFYNYRVGTVVHASEELGRYSRMSVLSVTHDLTGHAALGTLFLSPGARASGGGGLLSRGRFMFIAEHRAAFGERVCAELRGWLDAEGRSPFWDGLGARFYQMSYEDADNLSAYGKKSFVAELAPRYPLYVDMLPATARAVIGSTHPDTMPARRILESEGMRYRNCIDIFDAGPVLEAFIDDLHTARASVVLPAVVSANAGEAGGTPCLLANTAPMPAWRALQGRVRFDGPHAHSSSRVILDAAEARLLGIQSGDPVRVLGRASGVPVAREQRPPASD